MKNNPLPRLDEDLETRELLLPHCRLALGEVWADPVSGHRVACADATDEEQIAALTTGELATLAIHDPPYNLIAFERLFCPSWTLSFLSGG